MGVFQVVRHRRLAGQSIDKRQRKTPKSLSSVQKRTLILTYLFSKFAQVVYSQWYSFFLFLQQVFESLRCLYTNQSHNLKSVHVINVSPIIHINPSIVARAVDPNTYLVPRSPARLFHPLTQTPYQFFAGVYLPPKSIIVMSPTP